MIKFLALTLMIAAPISATALTAEQEIKQKCELRTKMRTSMLNNKTIFDDKRICECVTGSVKAKAGKNLQDVADFYSEKYDLAHSNPIDADGATIASLNNECIQKFFSKDQINAERKKVMEANRKRNEEKANQLKIQRAEEAKKAAAAKDQFKKEMQGKQPVNYTPIPAKQPAGKAAQ